MSKMAETTICTSNFCPRILHHPRLLKKPLGVKLENFFFQNMYLLFICSFIYMFIKLLYYLK